MKRKLAKDAKIGDIVELAFAPPGNTRTRGREHTWIPVYPRVDGRPLGRDMRYGQLGIVIGEPVQTPPVGDWSGLHVELLLDDELPPPPLPEPDELELLDDELEPPEPDDELLEDDEGDVVLGLEELPGCRVRHLATQAALQRVHQQRVQE